MTPEVGDVVRFITSDVLRQESAPKHHLCINKKHRQYLLISSKQYYGDLSLSNVECGGLENKFSFVSVSRVLFRSSIPKGATRTCTVSADFLRTLYEHVKASRVTAPIDKEKIMEGIADHLKTRLGAQVPGSPEEGDDSAGE